MFEEPAKVPTFCAECGTKGMSQCPSCKEFIAYDDSKVHHVPNYCTQYGQAFPWTITTLQLANEYTDELDLSAEDKLTLKNSILDLTRDTPKTEIAIGRFKRVYNKEDESACVESGDVNSLSLKFYSKLLDLYGEGWKRGF